MNGVYLGLSIALGLYLLPRLVRLSAYLITSSARTTWWVTMWLFAHAICRRAETPEIRQHAVDAKDHALALALLAWGRSPDIEEHRAQLVERWTELGTELGELRRATREAP